MLYKNPIQAFKGILSSEGASGLYRGMGANLIGVFPVQALKLASNDLFRELLADEQGHVSTIRGVIAGAGAGCVQVIASNPMEITKIRLQIQNTLPLTERKNIAGGTSVRVCVSDSVSRAGSSRRVQGQLDHADARHPVLHDLLPAERLSRESVHSRERSV